MGFFKGLIHIFFGDSGHIDQQESAPQQQQRPPPVIPKERWEEPRPRHRPPPRQPQPPSPARIPQSLKPSEPKDDPYYTSLRARARSEGDAMAKAFEESHIAYASKDGARAKALSEEAKVHKRNMEEFNRQASEFVFNENNKDRAPGEVDLHGLFVKEAITFTETCIHQARKRGESQVHLIVGKGLHSTNNVAKLKPAIEELIQREQLFAELDPNNSGVLIVHIGSATGVSRERVLGAEEITRTLEDRDKGCIIM